MCVPVHDAGPGLAATLRSIVDQDTEIEVVVLDNTGHDETADIASAFDDPRLRVVRNAEVLPAGENWNKAVWLSTGRLVKVVRPGELLLPGALDKQRELMGDNGIAVCAARYRRLDAGGRIERADLGLSNLLGPCDSRALLRTLVWRGAADFGPTAAAVFRRRDFDRVGGFRGDLLAAVDVDLFARVCAFGRFFGMAENLAARAATPPASGLGELGEALRFHHRMGAEYPELLGRAIVLGGDLRLARSAVERLRLRAARSRRPEPHLNL
ncbi:glycosyltransferase family 2 protein [Nocardia sp. NPDC057668]|uniref:glycosyltransferase family 2 protein n=1 Tax=Nocardia sp. NPDC057668 TaxID=3346202 RepID=UPI00366F1876